MDRYLCIHGHFYQPPRENPWLEDIELQDSAYPYHDWDERITAECYAPNTAARILDGDWIVKILNNYANMSFNFGPTVLDWMEQNKPEVYRAIIESDRESRQNFSGHGSALAQTYNHMIMPLACKEDKYTQVFWGIRDFEHRFGRKPEAIWLPETAVDLETLDIAAEQGISFVILAQHQARKYRAIGSSAWEQAGDKGIDPSMCYLLNLPSGRKINIFFYDGPVSRAVAFEKLLANGERFANRLLGGFSDTRTRPQLMHIATDGETYGHHHFHGDMALAYALNFIRANKSAVLTNYAEFLELHPPTHEVEIIENSSWSCLHGIERWRNDCGCNAGGHPGWNQAWRTPLRNAMNWLRNALRPKYEELARRYIRDPWVARNDYISVILDRSTENVDRFLGKHAVHPLNPAEEVNVLKLLEMQRHAMLMFTSCGWFFDELSGIETVQVIQYAGRAIQLAQELFDKSYEPEFLELLSKAKSNIEEYRDGENIYQKFVKPAMLDLPKVGAHYAISSLFKDYGAKSQIYCYNVEQKDRHDLSQDGTKATIGQVEISSVITRESTSLSYGVLYSGAHNIKGGVRMYRGEEDYRRMLVDVNAAFNRSEIPEVLRLLDQHFKGMTYSLGQLFRDEQRAIINKILDSTLEEAEADYRRIFDRQVELMHVLKELNIPQPKAFHTAAAFVVSSGLRRAFKDEMPDLEKIYSLLNEAKLWEIKLDEARIAFALEDSLGRLAGKLSENPYDTEIIGRLDAVIEMVRTLPFEVNLWKLQNSFHGLLHTLYPDMQQNSEHGEKGARHWLSRFTSLGEKLRMKGTA
ncbi:MAG: DUF3536 domain-containing protein [Bacillota bacterium]